MTPTPFLFSARRRNTLVKITMAATTKTLTPYISLIIAGLIGLAYGYANHASMPKQLGALSLMIGVLGTPLLLLEEKNRRAVIRRLGRLVLGVGVFATVFFLAGELVLRLVFLEGESFGSHGGPIVKRFERDFRFNRFDGPSRGPEPSGPKSTNRTRLLIQGDSITWGQAVRNEQQLFSSLLLAKLGESGMRFDMAVLARPGREIDGHLQQLKKWGKELEPDAIIYQWYINDIELEKDHRPRRQKPWHRLFFHATLARNSYLWWFLDDSVERLLPPPSQSYESYISSHFEEGSADWLAFEQQFSEWTMLAKELTPKVIVALYPHMLMTPGEPPIVSSEITSIHARMMTLCVENNLVCIDLSKWFIQFDDSQTIKATAFDGHPSAEAHRAIAEALYETLRVSWPGIF